MDLCVWAGWYSAHMVNVIFSTHNYILCICARLMCFICISPLAANFLFALFAIYYLPPFIVHPVPSFHLVSFDSRSFSLSPRLPRLFFTFVALTHNHKMLISILCNIYICARCTDNMLILRSTSFTNIACVGCLPLFDFDSMRQTVCVLSST